MTTPASALAPAASEQLRRAVADRPRADYQFHFWTAFGWTLLTLGIYSFYVFYQLIRRSREHNRRRVTLVTAAIEFAWDRAIEQNKADELRPAFDRVAADVEHLRGMDGEVRDPTLWTLLAIIGNGIVWAFGAILLDQDLVQHERYERAAEGGLNALFSALGITLPAPGPATKQPHNYVGRIIATVISVSVYSLWWVADLMREGNHNYEADYAWEDALLASLPDTRIATN